MVAAEEDWVVHLEMAMVEEDLVVAKEDAMGLLNQVMEGVQIEVV